MRSIPPSFAAVALAERCPRVSGFEAVEVLPEKIADRFERVEPFPEKIEVDPILRTISRAA